MINVGKRIEVRWRKQCCEKYIFISQHHIEMMTMIVKPNLSNYKQNWQQHVIYTDPTKNCLRVKIFLLANYRCINLGPLTQLYFEGRHFLKLLFTKGGKWTVGFCSGGSHLEWLFTPPPLLHIANSYCQESIIYIAAPSNL